MKEILVNGISSNMDTLVRNPKLDFRYGWQDLYSLGSITKAATEINLFYLNNIDPIFGEIYNIIRDEKY